MTREEFINEVEECLDSLRRFLLSLCDGDLNLADDVAQDALLKAWLKKSSFSGRSKFSTWIFRVAYNTWLDSRKSFYTSKKTDMGMASGEIAEERADFRIEHEDLKQAMGCLTPNERTVVSLRYIEGYSLKEITYITGIPAATVASHLFRARKKLKKLISR